MLRVRKSRRKSSTSWAGLPYVNRNGEEERAGYFKVKNTQGNLKEFRLGVKNEIILKTKFGVKSYAELINATLVLMVKHYQLGNGFVVVDLKREAVPTKASQAKV